MKVLYVASEAVPFVKTGGLADVVGALPQYIDKKTGEPIANAYAKIYVFFEDEERKNEEAAIETQTDSDGWLWVEHIPDGVELYTMFD